MVAAAEKALDQLMHKLPADYRRRPLPNQPDIVWGERVLPNFRMTLEALNTGYIQRSKGEWAPINLSGNVKGDIRGQTSDYPSDWMPKELDEEFDRHQILAAQCARNMNATADSEWRQGSLSTRYSSESRGPLNPPTSWPRYRLNPTIQVKTGEVIKVSGIYLPQASESCAQVFIEGFQALDANIGYDPRTTNELRCEDTTWTLVEREADSGGGVPVEGPDSWKTGLRLRTVAGDPCPQSGYWLTPASLSSRRKFTSGDVMPEIGGDYGATIWQWDEQQD
jgi:hypothetical protein